MNNISKFHGETFITAKCIKYKRALICKLRFNFLKILQSGKGGKLDFDHNFEILTIYSRIDN